jgi:predicted HTH transcriptional regulator
MRQRVSLGTEELIVFEVPIAPEAVMVEGNGFPYRVGDQIVREPQEVINARKEAYRRVGYEQRIQPEATLDDIDLELAKRFLSRTVYGDREVPERLERYGLIHPRSAGPAITNACLLLFAKGPAVRWHPRAGIRFFRVKGKERRHGAQRNVTQVGRVEPPLAQAIGEAHRLARQQIG